MAGMPVPLTVPRHCSIWIFFLYDITGTQSAGDWQYLASSESLWKTANLWMMLDADQDYAMQVKTAIGQTAFDWDYALAWQVTAVPVPVAFWLFGSGLLGLIGIGGRWKKKFSQR